VLPIDQSEDRKQIKLRQSGLLMLRADVAEIITTQSDFEVHQTAQGSEIEDFKA